jgi:hypothetical protein
MRFTPRGSSGERSRNGLVRRTIVALVIAGGALAGCSSDHVTGPTTNQNVELMARFDSVLGTLDPGTQARRGIQFTEVITLLAFGAPVQTVQITQDGTTQSYSGVGTFIVSDDVEGNPQDSAYTLLAWRGDFADTLISVVMFQGVSSFEVTDASRHVVSTGQPVSSAIAQPPGDTCTTYLDHLPPDVDIPSGLTCRNEAVTVSASGNTLTTGSQTSTGTFAVPSQSVRSVRIEGQSGT